ncbi:MAG: hypothetical protein GVY16_03295 [Planctomycetes bacterium]|jgi:tetratricopeptide (TPR) repeat protein|nr:hypothetical protein [Planctomycetota bacterium]
MIADNPTPQQWAQRRALALRLLDRASRVRHSTEALLDEDVCDSDFDFERRFAEAYRQAGVISEEQIQQESEHTGYCNAISATAQSLIRMGQTREAISLLRRCPDPNRINASRLIRALLMSGDVEAAAGTAIETEQSILDVFVAAKKAGKNELADTLWDKYQESVPQHTYGVLLAKSKAKYRVKQPKAAIKLCEQAYDVAHRLEGRRRTIALHCVQRTWVEIGEPHQAIALMGDVQEIRGPHRLYDTMMDLIEQLARAGHVGAAEDVAARIEDRDGFVHGAAMSEIAKARALRGQYDKAFQLVNGLSVRPLGDYARCRLVGMLLKGGREKQAIELMNKAMAGALEEPYAREAAGISCGLARELRQAGRGDLARTVLERAAKLLELPRFNRRNRTYIRLKLGRQWFRLGDIEAARRVWAPDVEAVIASTPGHRGSNFAWSAWRLAEEQARAGDVAGVLEWIARIDNADVRAAALLGAAEGLLPAAVHFL